MNQEEQVVQEEGVSTPSPVSQPISYARQNRAERLKQAAIEPDFVKQKVPNYQVRHRVQPFQHKCSHKH